jgi:hypothetical protein
MPDEKTVITNPDDKGNPAEKPLLEEVRSKSFQQILKEQAAARSTVEPDKPLETPEEDKKKEEEAAKAKEEQEAKQKQEAEEAERKRQEELARKAAEEVVSKQKEEEQAKLDKIKAEEDEKQRQEALKPKFTGRDKDGNVVPKDYEELTAESVRIAEEKAVARLRTEQAERDAAAKVEQEKIQQTQAQKEAAEKAYQDDIQKELDADLNDLYANNKLPKIKDPKDENDPGNKEFKNLFETAQKVNADRMAKGLPPIRSIKLIYYEHYKPLAKPAGHDAPVMGNESPLSKEAPEDKYVPARDRHKSMAQLVKEEAARLSRKMNIRGN